MHVFHPMFACICMRLVRVSYFPSVWLINWVFGFCSVFFSSASLLSDVWFCGLFVFYQMFACTCVYFWVLCFSSVSLLPDVCFCLFASNSLMFLLPSVCLYFCVDVSVMFFYCLSTTWCLQVVWKEIVVLRRWEIDNQKLGLPTEALTSNSKFCHHRKIRSDEEANAQNVSSCLSNFLRWQNFNYQSNSCLLPDVWLKLCAST